MNPIIHLGYPKTATTWFQRNFYPFVQNAYIPHHNLIKKNIINPFNLNYQGQNYIDGIISEAGSKRMIICEENLIGSLQNGGMQGYHTKEIGLRLKSLFPNAEIIIFIRNQPEMIASAYIQYVKGGGNYSLKTYLFDKQYDFSNSRMLFTMDFFRYHEVVEFYQSLFGEEKVHLFLYEEFAENNKEFIKSFSDRFSFKINSDLLDYSFANVRLRKGLIQLARLTNSFSKRPIVYKYYLIHIPFWYKFNKQMLLNLNKFKIFGRFPDAQKLFGKEIIAWVNDYYRESNQQLYDNMKLKSLSQYNYPL